MELGYKKIVILKKFVLFMLFIVLCILFAGCSVNTSLTPWLNLNPENGPEDNSVSYIKVSVSSSSTKINETIQLVVKGYNSDDQWVILDKSKVKAWKWTVQGQCYNCIAGDVELSPKSDSLTTNFTSGVAGTFFIAAYYQENISDGYITDYIEIKVTK